MNILLWIVQILVGLLFMFSGVMKFVMPYSEMTKDAPWVLPHWFLLFIGACELLGGIGLTQLSDRPHFARLSHRNVLKRARPWC